MAGGVDHAVRARADQVAEGGEQLEENGGGLGLSVRGQGADGESGEAVESGFAKCGAGWRTGWGGLTGWGRRSGVGVRLRLRPRLRLDAEQFGPAALYVREGGHNGTSYPRDRVANHNTTLVRFLISVEGVSHFSWRLISHRRLVTISGCTLKIGCILLHGIWIELEAEAWAFWLVPGAAIAAATQLIVVVAPVSFRPAVGRGVAGSVPDL